MKIERCSILTRQCKPYRTFYFIGSNLGNQCQLSSKYWRISRFLWWLRIEWGKLYLHPSGRGHAPRIIYRQKRVVRHAKVREAIDDMRNRIAGQLAQGYERAPLMWDELCPWKLKLRA